MFLCVCITYVRTYVNLITFILYSEEKGRAAILQSQMQEIRERQAEAALMEQQRSSLLKEQEN